MELPQIFNQAKKKSIEIGKIVDIDNAAVLSLIIKAQPSVPAITLWVILQVITESLIHAVDLFCEWMEHEQRTQRALTNIIGEIKFKTHINLQRQKSFCPVVNKTAVQGSAKKAISGPYVIKKLRKFKECVRFLCNTELIVMSNADFIGEHLGEESFTSDLVSWGLYPKNNGTLLINEEGNYSEVFLIDMLILGLLE